MNSRTKRIAYKVKINESGGANVKMIFKSINSILSGRSVDDGFDFGEVPTGEDVILIAIKKKGDQLFFGKKELNIEVASKLNLDFTEVSIQELRKELEKLNGTFDVASSN